MCVPGVLKSCESFTTKVMYCFSSVFSQSYCITGRHGHQTVTWRIKLMSLVVSVLVESCDISERAVKSAIALWDRSRPLICAVSTQKVTLLLGYLCQKLVRGGVQGNYHKCFNLNTDGSNHIVFSIGRGLLGDLHSGDLGKGSSNVYPY